MADMTTGWYDGGVIAPEGFLEGFGLRRESKPGRAGRGTVKKRPLRSKAGRRPPFKGSLRG